MRKLKKTDLSSVKVGTNTVLELTVPELLRLWFRNVPVANESIREARQAKWMESFKHLPAWEVGPEHIAHMVSALEEAGYKAATINREVGEFRACYNWAIKKRHSPRDFMNPCREYQPRKEPMRRVELDEEEIGALLAAAKLCRWQKMYALVLLALHSGARRSEMLNLTWADVDLNRRRAMLHTTKSGRPRELLLTEEVVQALRALQFKEMRPDMFVFCGKNFYRPHDIRKAWATVRKNAGLPDLHLHDLRHAACAKMLKSGASTHLVSTVLGHVDGRMVSARYGHLDSDHLQSVVDAAWG